MYRLEAIVIGCAVLFQFTSAVLALSLIRVTKRSFAWIAIAAAITLMGFRRLESLVSLLSGSASFEPDLLFELNGLVISILMLTGMNLIRPTFSALARSEVEQREMSAKLAALSKEQALLIGELQAALGNIRTLKGMLPICASCKKIRDDEGYWSQLEAYVSRHSEAEFTHAICPDCLRRLYPEYADLAEAGKK